MKKLILATIALTALLFSNGLVAQNNGHMVDRIVAVVGSQIIKESDIENTYEQYKGEGYAMTDSLRGAILDELMFRKLLVQQAIHDSVTVADADVDNELDRRMRYYLMQFGSEEAFEKFYGKTVEAYKFELRDRVKELLVVQRMQGQIAGDVTVSPAEVKSYYSRIPSDSLPLINSEVEVGQIVIKPPVNQELKEFTRQQLESIRQRVMSGSLDFCIAASTYSEDPGSKYNCGKYENVRRGTFVPEFDAVCFKLKEGEYSEVFETEYGFHFVRLISRKGEEVSMQHILMSVPTAPEDLQKCKYTLDSIMRLVRLDTMTFCEAAAKFSDDEGTKYACGLILNPMTGTSKIDMEILGQIDPNPDFPVIVGGLKVGAYSAPHQCFTSDGKAGYRVLWLKSRSEPHKANLKDDYQLIQDMALQEKQDQKMAAWVTGKLPFTYIRISEDYRKYKFKYPWLAYMR
jgi:peptidyl-prolyl cis-trans isomerase SurA